MSFVLVDELTKAIDNQEIPSSNPTGNILQQELFAFMPIMSTVCCSQNTKFFSRCEVTQLFTVDWCGPQDQDILD